MAIEFTNKEKLKLYLSALTDSEFILLVKKNNKDNLNIKYPKWFNFFLDFCKSFSDDTENKKIKFNYLDSNNKIPFEQLFNSFFQQKWMVKKSICGKINNRISNKAYSVYFLKTKK